MSESFELTGKHWILPDGHCIVVSCSEHARYSKMVMLGVSADDIHCEIPMCDIFKPLTPAEAERWLDRGADPQAIQFLCSDDESVDPRRYCINTKFWIRTRGSDFYAKFWDETAKLVLSNSAEFWAHQPKATGKTWATLYNVFDDGLESGPLRSLGIKRFAEV